MNLLDKKSHSSKEEEENEMTVSRKRKVSLNFRKAIEIPKICYARVIPENIMLVYLRRSSVQELLKDPETFYDNILGSYVRIQSDQSDHSYQLQQVLDVKKTPGCGEECILQVLIPPEMFEMKQIPISMLSDEYFKEEECKDLDRRVEDGFAYRPTVMELQRKAQMLHTVITKQWLARQLSLIQNLLDGVDYTGCCATEKRWRKELFEYLERKMLLQKPAEQEGILLTVPNVITEDLGPKSPVQKSAKYEKRNICSPKLTIVGTSTEDFELESTVQKSAEDEKRNICRPPKITSVGTSAGVHGRRMVEKLIKIGPIIKRSCISIEMNGFSEIAKNSRKPEIIDILDDTDDWQGVDDPDSALWYYEDPAKVIQGPFEARNLKKWKEYDYFEQGFKVWKSGQTPVLLDDLISQMFPN